MSASFEKIDEKATDANIKIYESVRSELIQRVILRDSALGLYIATVGTYLSSTINAHYSKPYNEIDLGYAIVSMMPFPIVCSIFSLIIIQHHLTIGRMGAFLRSEMNWSQIHGKISSHWDNSASFLKQANFLITLRMYAQGLVLCSPFIYSIVFYCRFFDKAQTLGWYWGDILAIQLIINITAVCIIVYLHFYAHHTRKKDW